MPEVLGSDNLPAPPVYKVNLKCVLQIVKINKTAKL